METLELFSPTRWGPCRELSQPPGPAGSQEVGCKQPQGPLCSFLFLFGPAGSRWAAGSPDSGRGHRWCRSSHASTRGHGGHVLPGPKLPPHRSHTHCSSQHSQQSATERVQATGPVRSSAWGSEVPTETRLLTGQVHRWVTLRGSPAHPFVCVVQTHRHRDAGTAGGCRDIRQEGGGPGDSGHTPSRGETLCSEHAHS